VKTDSNGNKQWDRNFTGTGYEGICVRQTSDGGYILAGGIWSQANWNSDLLLIKTDSNGNMQWNRTFGGAGNDNAEFVRQTLDDGYIIAGKTWSYDAGMNDFWLIKTDSNGILQWHNTYGDTGNDKAYSVYQTFDGGYIIAGEKESGFNKYDFWLIKLKGDSTEPDKKNH